MPVIFYPLLYIDSSNFRFSLAGHADSNTITAIALYFGVRRGKGPPKTWHHSTIIFVVMIWGVAFLLTCFPLFVLHGRLGFDVIQGKCIMNRIDHMIMAISDLIRCIIVVVSYGLVFRTLKNVEKSPEVRSKRKAVLVLIASYILFILPHSVFESLQNEFDVPYKVEINLLVHFWYYCNYFINFFIYVYYWRRMREGMKIMFKDLFSMHPSIEVCNSITTEWWMETTKSCVIVMRL